MGTQLAHRAHTSYQIRYRQSICLRSLLQPRQSLLVIYQYQPSILYTAILTPLFSRLLFYHFPLRTPHLWFCFLQLCLPYLSQTSLLALFDKSSTLLASALLSMLNLYLHSHRGSLFQTYQGPNHQPLLYYLLPSYSPSYNPLSHWLGFSQLLKHFYWRFLYCHY